MSGNFNKNEKENNDKNIFIKILDWGKKVRLHHANCLQILKSKFSIKIFIMSFCSLYLLYAFIFLFTNLYLSHNLFFNDFNNGKYKKAIENYNKVVKINTILGLKNTSDTFYAKFVIADCYLDYGDLNTSLKLFKQLLADIQKYYSNDKENLNLISYYIALIYGYLGEYQNANSYIKLCDDITQVDFYITTCQLDKIKIESHAYVYEKKLLESIKNNNDKVDFFRPIYKLGRYYISTKQYSKAKKLYKENIEIAHSDENKIWIKLFLANLYRITNNYQESKILYNDVLTKGHFSFNTLLKIKIEYFFLLKENGDLKEAKILLKEIQRETDKYFFETNAMRICAKYYELPLLNGSEKILLNKEIDNLFKKLDLKQENRFYNNIKDFCKINSRY